MQSIEETTSHIHPAHGTFPVLICLLGNFRVLAAGKLLKIRGVKAEALLCSLALRDQFSIPRETLLDKLWPDTEHTLAGQSLNTLVYSLHKMFKVWLGGSAPVLHDQGSYRLNTEAEVGVDVAAFERWAKAGDQEARSGNLTASVVAYTRAVHLYTGDLNVVADVQAIVQREQLRARYLTILARLADGYYTKGDYSTCLEYANRLLARDRCREDAHRLMMRCHIQMGERAQALRQYRICEQILRAEFGMIPEHATQALFDQILGKSTVA
jgi:DNA-binding SARP family transcriptional activator